MPFWLRRTDGELKRLQTTANEISDIVAELYDLPRTSHELILATTEEIKKMKAERGEQTGHNESYIRSDGVIVICKPEGEKNPRIKIAESLAAEFAHVYHKLSADNSREPVWSYMWIDRTRLDVSPNRVLRVILPLSMLKANIIPRGKREATDVYCQAYVLEQLGEMEAAKENRQSNCRWNEIVKDDLDVMNSFFIDSKGKPVSYDKVRQTANGIIQKAQVGTMTRDEYTMLHRYLFLADGLGCFMSHKYAQTFSTVNDFRSFVRTPVFPITPTDIDFFNKSLGDLNEFLKKNNSITLAIRKDAPLEGFFGAAAYVPG